MAKTIDPKKQVHKVVRTIAGGSFGKRVIQVVRREYEVGNWTNDILVDGKVFSPANGDSILEEMLNRVQRAVLAGSI